MSSLPSGELGGRAPATGSRARPRRAWPVAVIARKELVERLRQAQLQWCGALLLALLLAALALGWQQAGQRHAETAAASEETYRQWLAQGERHPHSAAHFGQYAFKPVGPLALFDPGVDPYVGVTVWMEAHKQNEFRFRPARDATALARFGELSAAFVLQVLAPLLIVLIAFDAFTGERERGTLRQLLSLGVRPGHLLAGKMLAVCALAAAVVLPVVTAAALLSDAHADLPDALAQAALSAGGYVVYLCGFAALAIGVSAAAGSSRKALVLLLAFWVLSAFVVPRAMTEIARSLSPSPTATELAARIAQARKEGYGHDPTHPAYVALRDALLARHGVSRVEDLPVNLDAMAIRHDDEVGYRAYDRFYGELWASYVRQERIRALAGVVFPTAAMQLFSMNVAGTGTAHHLRFAAAAEAYRRRIQTLTSDDLIRNRRNGDAAYVAGPRLWAQLPRFEYPAVPTAWTAARAALPLAAVLAWALGATAFAFAMTRRLRPV